MTKILLVEDDKSLREIYGVRLLAEGYDIVSAGDGEEALALAIKDRPSLIVSDVMMPKISGFDMLDILRSTTETKDIKVIMMTALSSEDQRQRGQALGADRYLVKSQVGIEDVVRAVHEVLGDAPVAAPTTNAFSTPAPAPAAPTAPAPVPTMPTPMSMTPPPVPPSAPPVAPSSPLPQPSAPFSTNRPANLGDRVIHPLTSSTPPTNFAAMMDSELHQAPQPAPMPEPVAPPVPDPTPVAPAPQPIPAPAPAPSLAPVTQPMVPPLAQPAPMPTPMAPPAPAAPVSGLNFEETPAPVPAAAPQLAPPPPAPPQTGV